MIFPFFNNNLLLTPVLSLPSYLPSFLPSILSLCCLLYLFLTMSFCLHSYCIHQILDSVSYAHQHDIVHRDLKVCVCVRACVCAFVLTLRAPVALHMLPLIAICLCLFFRLACACLSVCLSLIFFFLPRVIRLCIWNCFCTILDGLKQKLES